MRDTALAENLVSHLTDRNAATAVGRSATGLLILLSLWKSSSVKQKIALPSFLCQSPLAAILLAGWEPVFCDIDLKTGNVPLSEWLRVTELGVDAILFVHLFGNVCDASYIVDICKNKKIYFIEDAAQSLGGDWEGRPSGSFGDVSLVSFGHTKLINVGHGGMVLTNDTILAKEIKKFDLINLKNDIEVSLIAKKFKEKYYYARNYLQNDSEMAKYYFKGLLSYYSPLVKSRWKPEKAEVICNQIKTISLLTQKRKQKLEIYQELLRDTPLIPLKMSKGSVPWRAVFRLPSINWKTQNDISEAVRAADVDISNWYIPSHWMMDETEHSVNSMFSTEKLSKEVFQLWLDDDTSLDEINYAAAVLKRKIMELSYE